LTVTLAQVLYTKHTRVRVDRVNRLGNAKSEQP
jgi:hypothetical protein